MGRPNREQVVTERASAATTLQALELTNGSTLSAILHKGSTKLLEKYPGTDEVIVAVYQRSLGRDPDAAEFESAREMVGSPATANGTEDLMWAVFMLPEFQLIR